MFSGVECARAAWECIESAVQDRFHIRTGVKFVAAVA